MLTMASTMPVGFYDWEPDLFPRAEYEARIAALWARVSDPGCAGIVVYGNLLHHGELAWLTNFMPKLDNGFLVLKRDAPPMLLGAQSRNHLQAARPLTWIEDVRVMQNPGKLIQEHLAGPEDGTQRNHPLTIAFVGDAYLRTPLRRELREGLAAEGQEPQIVDVTADVATLMRAKRPRELDAIRRAAAALAAARAAFAGASIWGAVSAAETAAYRQGAQDVRSLASLDGGRSYRPLVTPPAQHVAAPRCYMAVRYSGYWAEGFFASGGTGGEVAGHAAAGLAAALASCRAGARAGDLAQKSAAAIAPCAPHALTATDFGSGIGLALDEAPHIAAGDETALVEGEVLAVRVGASRGSDHAIRSALVRVTQSGAETLFTSD